MRYINICVEFGVVIRRAAIKDKKISMNDILRAFETNEPFDVNDDLISFGPSFGQEALDTFVKRLLQLGLEYFDDFFEVSGVFPTWCQFHASLRRTDV